MRKSSDRSDRYSSVAIEDLLQNYQPSRPRVAVAYYYFNFQSKAEQQFTNLLRSVLLQLSCQCPTLPHSVKRLREHEQYSPSSDEDLIRVVREVFMNFGDIYIVIDAFDECEQSEEVLQWIKELLKSDDGRLHLLFSSRQDFHFRNVLELSPTSFLGLDERTFEKDIQLYIREQLASDPRMKKWPANVKADIEETLTTKTGGL